MVDKLYSNVDRELVFDRSEKWIKLIGLINDITGTDEPSWSPPPQDELEELQYQSLRFWFMSHQAKFIVSWDDYYWEWAPEQYYNEDTSDLEDINEYLANPYPILLQT